MTVEKLETAQALVDEIGIDDVEAVYRYVHSLNKKTMYAVFPKGQYIDIHEAPYATEVCRVFADGAWGELP